MKKELVLITGGEGFTPPLPTIFFLFERFTGTPL